MAGQYNRYMIVGAARSGIAVAEFLNSHKKDCVLTDIKTYEELAGEGYGIENTLALAHVQTVFGRQPSEEEIRASELVILSPGVSLETPVCKTAAENGIRIISEIEFAYSFFKGKVAAVTGTNGKTTTTTLTGELLKNAGIEAYVGGNIGDPFINYVETASEHSVIALEISSFQLELAERLRPRVAVITNITPDHLDRHKTMENYIAAKAKVFMNMKGDDVLILNYDDENTRNLAERANCRVLFFSVTDNRSLGAYLSGNEIIINTGSEPVLIADRKQLKLLGLHNAANVMCAALCAYLLGADADSIRKTLADFNPVEHRIEFVREVDSVKYINDSKGTNPEATMTAINAVDDPIVLILGGYDKQSDFDELFELIKRKVRHCVVLGQTKHKIAETAEKCGYSHVTLADTFEKGLKEASRIAHGGDCVLLSPACASWDMFDNYETRGKVFKQLVNKL